MQKITFIFKMLKYLTVLAFLFFFKIIILRFKPVIKRFIAKFNDERL